jgi:hypothetical protein
MSAPAPTSPDQIAAAIAHAERRLWLLEVMIRFCMALARALKPGGAAGDLLGLAWAKAYAAISRGVRLGIRLEIETRRLLRDLRAGILPAAKAERPRRAEAEELEDLEEREAGERVETESDTAFRARLEALEALLDQEAHADWSVQETVHRLCRVLGLEPEWSRWLGDDWLENNLALSPPCGKPGVAPGARRKTDSARLGRPRRARLSALLDSASRSALLAPPPWPPPRRREERPGGPPRLPWSEAPTRHGARPPPGVDSPRAAIPAGRGDGVFDFLDRGADAGDLPGSIGDQDRPPGL